MTYQAPKGVFDILPDNHFDKPCIQSSSLWKHVESTCKEVAELYNFNEIRTPIFEHTEIFLRSSGETSDIVSKEMYTFTDKGERSLTLRPEGTASVTRALVENQMLRKKSVQKLYYTGPFFRYDRPQAGRYRQFHQFGAEVYGLKDPELDAEMICMLMHIFEKLGLKNLTVMINSIGDLTTRENYKNALIEFLTPFKDKLSKDSQSRLEKNPLRILDSKDKQDQSIVAMAPSISNFFSPDSKLHFERVCQTLSSLNIPYVINDQLVRGLDYYNETVFEVVMHNSGSQNTIGAGGRYDGLLAKLGGNDSPSVGFALGIERTIMTLIEQNLTKVKENNLAFYIIPLDHSAKKAAMQVANNLRKSDISCEVHHKNFKIQKGLQEAYDLKARFAIILGEEELKNHTIKIKNLENKTETTISASEIMIEAKKLILKL